MLHILASLFAATEPVDLTQLEEKAKLQEQAHNTQFYTEFFNMLVTLVFIIALIIVVSWLLKRLLNTRARQMNESSAIKILERRSLTPKSTLYLLDVEGKKIMIAETHTGVTYLTEVQEESKASFNQILQSKMKQE